tara:strand:- start:1159 stop:1440 length:282 start_codon:yes stop_codon:yes gene_type:complete
VAQEGWHLSKSVPATLLFGLITQGAAIVWTVSSMSGDIERNAIDITRNRMDLSNSMMRIGDAENNIQTQAVDMAVINSNIQFIKDAVEKMAKN